MSRPMMRQATSGTSFLRMNLMTSPRGTPLEQQSSCGHEPLAAYFHSRLCCSILFDDLGFGGPNLIAANTARKRIGKHACCSPVLTREPDELPHPLERHYQCRGCSASLATAAQGEAYTSISISIAAHSARLMVGRSEEDQA